MNTNARRRDFLKVAATGTSMFARAAQTSDESTDASTKKLRAADVRISSTPYIAVADYPIRPKTYSDVTLKDSFWKPKVTANAEVTIPFEVRKFSQLYRAL